MIYRYDGALPSVDLQGYDGTATDGTTVTITGLAFGPASSRRRLVACLQFACLNIPSSVTIGGVAATRVVGAVVSTSTRAEIWVALVPTGTSGSVVITAASTVENPSVALIAANGLLSSTPTDTASDTVGALSLPVDISSRGVVCCVAQTVSGGTLGDSTWVNATEVIEFTNPGVSSARMSVATYVATSAETNRAISVSGFVGFICGCAASFR